MADIGEYDLRDRPHVAIDAWREATAFSLPARQQRRKPLRGDYVAHALALLDELAQALPPPVQGAPPVAGLPSGALIAVETLPPAGARQGAAKVPVELEVDDIVILRTSRKDDRSESVVVFVPDTSRQPLQQRLQAYGQADVGNARRPNLARFEILEHIQAAGVLDLFSGPVDLAGPARWWEVWTRRLFADGVAVAAEARGWLVYGDRLVFPDTSVILVHAQPADLLGFASEIPGALAEIRPATGTLSPFLVRGPTVGPEDWVADLAERLVAPVNGAPLVGILDTGVSGAHPVITPGLAGAYAYDEAWGADDHHPDQGHGTNLASLVLLGDLVASMQSQGPVAMSHGVVSMKVLPPPGFPPNQPQHYGLVTQAAVALVEIEHPEVRTYCLATSTPDYPPERPSSWSGAIDQIAAGSSPAEAGDPPLAATARPKRLVLVAAGNVTGGPRDQVLASAPIEDPAQSWNALTIGGWTGKDDADLALWPRQPLAAVGDVSPFSSTSAGLAGDLTPIKPEVLFESGNMAVDLAGMCDPDPVLSLLAAGADVAAEPLTHIWATSAATGLAGRFTGQLEAALPGFWPETYRALAVQSAEWGPPIRARIVSARGDHWRTATSAARQALLRRVGYGAPSVTRAIASARNAVTLTAQAELQPFTLSPQNNAVYNEMHFYDLPWPRHALEALENEIVTMKVTLSYFIEPNLSGRAATRPDTYRSVGLRFVMKKRSETAAQFRRRVNAAQEGEREPSEAENSYWLLGPRAISAGSLHCDIWRGRAIDLALHDKIAIYPVGGWWKSHRGQGRVNDRCRYSLLLSISAPGQAVDLHAEVAALVEARAAEVAVEVG